MIVMTVVPVLEVTAMVILYPECSNYRWVVIGVMVVRMVIGVVVRMVLVIDFFVILHC